MQIKMCKNDQLVKCIFLHCYPDFILSKKLSRCDTYFICVFDPIKFCKVVLNIFKLNMEYSVHSAFQRQQLFQQQFLFPINSYRLSLGAIDSCNQVGNVPHHYMTADDIVCAYNVTSTSENLVVSVRSQSELE